MHKLGRMSGSPRTAEEKAAKELYDNQAKEQRRIRKARQAEERLAERKERMLASGGLVSLERDEEEDVEESEDAGGGGGRKKGGPGAGGGGGEGEEEGEAAVVVDGIEEEKALANKLTGFDWYRSIGMPTKIVAPMVDQSELGYRMLTRAFGAELVYTQMFNSSVFSTSPEYRRSNFVTCPGDRPLIVQFCGNDPDLLLASARLVQDKCDAVDINLGCPQMIAKRGRYGAFLMEELELLTRMVSTLAKNLRVPVTCKTRIYKDFDRSLRLVQTLVDAGASLVTIHGRTREEKGQLVGEVDWETIRRLKAHFAGRVPIIANGGISDMDDVLRCLQVTGCDGVMTSEAILENPGLFSRNLDSQGKLYTQVDMADAYLDECEKYPVWHYRTMRSHMQKLLHRYCTVHTNLREMNANAITVEEFREVVQATRQEIIASGMSDEMYTESWYSRHRNPAHLHAGRSGICDLPEAIKINIPKDRVMDEEGDDEDVLSSIFG